MDKKSTIFSAALKLVGLSQREAADFFEVRPDTVRSWACGRSRVPPNVWEELRELYDKQQDTVDEALALIEQHEPGILALNIHGARGAEWPSEGVHLAVLAQLALEAGLPLDSFE